MAEGFGKKVLRCRWQLPLSLEGLQSASEVWKDGRECSVSSRGQPMPELAQRRGNPEGPSSPRVVTHMADCSSLLLAGALSSTRMLSKALAMALVLEKATWSPDIQTLFPQFPLRGLPPISKPKYCRTQFSSPTFGGAYLPCPRGDALISHACPLSGVE